MLYKIKVNTMIRLRARRISENLKGTLGESNALPASSFVPFLLENSMKRIPLSRGQYALVDDEDYEKVNKYKWNAVPNNKTYRASSRCTGNGKNIRMHRFIMNAPKNMDVDHINHDTLDNRKCNLRICTRSQNLMNAKKRSGCSSKYKGVTYSKSPKDRCLKKWVACIYYKSPISLGRHKTEIEAALAYNKAAKKYFGEYALLNIIGE